MSIADFEVKYCRMKLGYVIKLLKLQLKNKLFQCTSYMYNLNYLHVWQDKKILITNHIVFTRNVPVWALPNEIRTMAHAISGRRFDHEFVQWFLPQYCRGRGRKNLAQLVLSSAEFIIETFSNVWSHQGQTEKIPRGKRIYQVLLQSIIYACTVEPS